jgi:glucokinase
VNADPRIASPFLLRQSPGPFIAVSTPTHPPARHAIGIDIGGTKTAIAVVDVIQHRILSRTILATEAGLGFDRAVGRIADGVEEALRQADVSRPWLAGIGIGCAGPVDPIQGLINNPFTLEGWDRCDIVTPLRERFRLPVFLENDADAAAFGEFVAGAGQGTNPMVMLTFGTGVGGATIANGRIMRGVLGEHPELGHIPVRPDGPLCYCGIAGCLESIASGTALAAAGSLLGMPDARAVFAAADQGHLAAKAIVQNATHAAGIAAWTLCHTLLPQRLVLGGGIMETEFKRFATAMRQHLNTVTQFTRDAVDIVPASLGNDAGLVGAALLAAPKS